jgi:hypothetical protein
MVLNVQHNKFTKVFKKKWGRIVMEQKKVVAAVSANIMKPFMIYPPKYRTKIYEYIIA